MSSKQTYPKKKISIHFDIFLKAKYTRQKKEKKKKTLITCKMRLVCIYIYIYIYKVLGADK